MIIDKIQSIILSIKIGLNSIIEVTFSVTNHYIFLGILIQIKLNRILVINIVRMEQFLI